MLAFSRMKTTALILSVAVMLAPRFAAHGQTNSPAGNCPPSASTNTLVYYILGYVSRPGERPWDSSITVLNAVSTAGGLRPLGTANTKSLILRESGNLSFDLARILTKQDPDIRVEAGDTVLIGINRISTPSSLAETHKVDFWTPEEIEKWEEEAGVPFPNVSQ